MSLVVKIINESNAVTMYPIVIEPTSPAKIMARRRQLKKQKIAIAIMANRIKVPEIK